MLVATLKASQGQLRKHKETLAHMIQLQPPFFSMGVPHWGQGYRDE
jgi:hypothetical protein